MESEDAIDALNEAINILMDLQSTNDSDEGETENKIPEVIDCLEGIG